MATLENFSILDPENDFRECSKNLGWSSLNFMLPFKPGGIPALRVDETPGQYVLYNWVENGHVSPNTRTLWDAETEYASMTVLEPCEAANYTIGLLIPDFDDPSAYEVGYEMGNACRREGWALETPLEIIGRQYQGTPEREQALKGVEDGFNGTAHRAP